MTDKTDDILSLLPSRLKEARRAQGLSLEAVSNLSGVSRSMVSQIERGESSPTIATLWNLTRALQVDFAGLLEQRDSSARIDVLRVEQVPIIENMGSDCSITILSPPEEAGSHEVYDIRFGTNGRLTSAPHGVGTQEQLTVLSGSLEVKSGAAKEVIRVGDTARYAADTDHEILALEENTRAFLIVKHG